MKKSIQNTLRAVKRRIVEMFNRPRGITFGKGSYIRRPCTVHGEKRIHIGAHCMILGHGYFNAVEEHAGSTFSPEIRIGNHVYIGRYVYLTAMDKIDIEDDCVLSEHVYITDLMHGFDPEGDRILRQRLNSKGPVKIGRGCFIGYRAAIMPGVMLGDHCIVGANTVVTRSFPAYCMLAGSPARIIRKYDLGTKTWIPQ